MTTLEQALAEARQRISQLPHAAAKLEAELLLAFVLEQDRSYLYCWPERNLSETQLHAFGELVARRCAGEPIAYITGSREFWGLQLKVSPATLIPRPETEHLVEIALHFIPRHQSLHIADLGTGSGALALALASERPRCQITATDNSAAALDIAEYNRQHLQLDNVRFLPGRWFNPLTGMQFDMVVSNPPYVASDDPHLQQGDLRFEPQQALCSGVDGLQDIRDIIRAAPDYLRPGARLILEHGYRQGNAVTALLRQRGFRQVSCHQDYAERERTSLGQWPGDSG